MAQTPDQAKTGRSGTTEDEVTCDRQGHPKIIAFRTGQWGAMRVEPAPRWRGWMEETHDRFANRCLPLLVANEAGWVLLNPSTFEATWAGDAAVSSLVIDFADEHIGARPPVRSHFGYGIITWQVPYLFRTPPGFNLLARGPANWPKDGVSPLEGLIETDWAGATFTVSWKMTRANHPVTFEADEPFCMIVPQRRGELESFRPEVHDITSDPEMREEYQQWSESRDKMLARKYLYSLARDPEGAGKLWERHYFKGISPGRSRSREHQTKMRLSPFARPED